MSEPERARPEFLDHLEWQLRTELRRQRRFEELSPPRSWRTLRLAALVVLSITFGAAGVIAAERIQESGRRDLLLQRVQVRMRSAEERRQLLEEDLTRTEMLVGTGRAQQGEADKSRGRLEAVVLEGERLRLDLEEIQASGREPRLELSAPRVGGRDFVGERIELDLRAAERRLERERQREERLQRMGEMGLASSSEIAKASVGARREELLISELKVRRRLRADFLVGRLDARRVELEAMREGARGRLAQAESRLEHARPELDRLRTLSEAGLVSSTDLNRAEVEQREAQGELELARIELALIEEDLGD